MREQNEVWALVEFGDGVYAVIMAPKTDEGAKKARERADEIQKWFDRAKAN